MQKHILLICLVLLACTGCSHAVPQASDSTAPVVETVENTDSIPELPVENADSIPEVPVENAVPAPDLSVETVENADSIPELPVETVENMDSAPVLPVETVENAVPAPELSTETVKNAAPLPDLSVETAENMEEQRAAAQVLETQPVQEISYKTLREDEMPACDKLGLAMVYDVNWIVGSIEQRFYEPLDESGQTALLTRALREAWGIEPDPEAFTSEEGAVIYTGEEHTARYDPYTQSVTLSTPSLCDREVTQEATFDNAPVMQQIENRDARGRTFYQFVAEYPFDQEMPVHLTGGTHTLTEITGAVTDLMMERLGGERFDFVDAAWYENGGIPASLVPAAQGDRIPCSLRQITVRDYADGTQGVELTYGVTLRGIPVTPYRAQMIPDTGMEGASVTVRVERWGYVDAYRTDCAGLPASEVQLTHPAGKDYMEGSELLSLEEACRIADDHLTDPKTAYRVRLQYAILALKTNDVIQGRVLTPVWQFEFFHEDPYTFQLTPRESGGYVLDVDALTGEVYGWLAQ